jgi:putative ABC transport system permease protein
MPFEAARSFGGSTKTTGIDGASPKPGTVIITKDVAKELDVKAGSPIDLYLFGQKVTYNVDRIIAVNGLAGLNLQDSSGHSYNVFLPANTLTGIAEKNERNPDYITLISNKGDVFDGEPLTNTVSADIQTNVLNKLSSGQNSSDPLAFKGDSGGHLDKIKHDRIKEANDVGKVFRRLFIGIGSFTIIAGILLLINIFTMLAQERQSELGMMRAIGLRRRGMIVAFSLEGFLYALGSAFFGTLVGLGIGRIVAFVASGIFSTPEVGITLTFHTTFESLERGFVGGLGISMLTVVLASLFIARMNVIRAIRELPDNTLSRKRMIGTLLGIFFVLVGTAMVTLGIQNKNEFVTLSGPAVLAIGALLFLRRWIKTKPLFTVASIAVLFWSIFSFTLVKSAYKNPNAGIYVLQGVQLTTFAVVLISANQEHIGSIIRLVFRGTWSMALRLGLAYPLARRGRTGLLLAMYSLVIFVLTFIMTISNALTTSVEKQVTAQSGGADIELRQTYSSISRFDEGPPKQTPLPTEDIRKRADVAKVASLSTTDAEVNYEKTHTNTFGQVVAFDEGFLGNGSPKLKERAGDYGSDNDAFKAVAASSNLIILGNSLANDKNPANVIHPGAQIQLQSEINSPMEFDPETSQPVRPKTTAAKTYTVAAVSYTGPDVLIGQAGMNAFAPADQIRTDRAFIKVKDGVDPTQVANQLSGLYVADHIEATSIKQEVEDGFNIAKQFLMLIQGYMAIGLLVGIAGLGVVMVRAVRERRRQIGMLRAMGFPASAVRQSFLAESAFIAGEGILIGAVLALVVLNRTFSALPKDVGINLDVPWVELIALIGVTFIASILATAAPAQAASRISPAVALRTTD